MQGHVNLLRRHFEWSELRDWNFVVMVKNCCVVGCHNAFKKNSGIQFYRFPTNQRSEVNG